MVDLNLNPSQLLVKVAKDLGRACAQSIADYLGISLPTLYSWVSRYYGMTFAQFERKFLCRGRRCIVVDYSAADYQWRYTMTDRVNGVPRGCMCFIKNNTNLMMVTLPPEALEKALSADVLLDENTGIHHLKYPLRLPLYSGGDDD